MLLAGSSGDIFQNLSRQSEKLSLHSLSVFLTHSDSHSQVHFSPRPDFFRFTASMLDTFGSFSANKPENIGGEYFRLQSAHLGNNTSH